MSIQFISRRFSSLFKAITSVLVVCSFLIAPSALAAKPEQKSSVSELRVSINNASAQSLADSLVGVGTKKAQAIVAFRNKNGKFKTLDSLALVKGIGAATIEKNRTKLTL